MELVVLVDENNREIGTAEKSAVHSANTPLHRGFSLFLFNSRKQLLLTQRAAHKKTFPGVWTNTVCGHPAPGESVEEAAVRRLKQEVGISILKAQLIAPYRYRFADQNGIVENEICPVLAAKSNAYPAPNPLEVAAWKWIPWSIFLEEIHGESNKYSPWSVEEAKLVNDYLLRSGKIITLPT